jgi:hypothetical protein
VKANNNIFILFLLITTTIFSSQYILSAPSFAQNQNEQTNLENNTTFEGTTLTNEIDITNWTIISGNWNSTLEGLHGGSNDNTVSPLNNIILSPINPENLNTITTTFKVNDLDIVNASYASIIHSFIDPNNYQQAGINIYNDNVYVIFYKVSNGTLSSEPTWPGLKTDLEWTPGANFIMTLSDKGSSQDLIVNGTNYSLNDENDIDETNGDIGLGYGRMKSIDFKNFETQIPNISNQNNNLDSINNNISANSSESEQ